MTMVKNILGRVFAFWAALVFLISMLVFVLPIGLSVLWEEPRRSHVAYFFYSRWMKWFLFFSGVRRIIKGRENFKKGENYVVICNHNSMMDPPLSSPAIPGANKTIAKSEMAKIPVFSIIYKRGSVLVDRNSDESRRASYVQMKQVLEWGLHMCIYPEGTRNKTRFPMQRFQDGAFRLAVDCQKAIIPAVIFNTAKVLPRKKFFYWPSRVEIHFLKPIPVQNRSLEDVKKESFSVMTDYYQKYRDVL